MMSFREIGQREGIPERTAHKVCERALNKILGNLDTAVKFAVVVTAIERFREQRRKQCTAS